MEDLRAQGNFLKWLNDQSGLGCWGLLDYREVDQGFGYRVGEVGIERNVECGTNLLKRA